MEQDDRKTASDRRRALLAELWKLTPCLIVALAGILSQFQYLPNDDAAWLITVARRTLQGAALYSDDLVEINPPLIIQMTAVAVRMGAWLHLEPMTMWRLLVAGQIVLSLWLSGRWLTILLARNASELRYPLMALLAWIFACLPGYDYGQREHFIVLWVTPYLLAATERCVGIVSSRRLRATAGLLLGLTLCLKPQYLLVVLLVEAGVLAHRRSLQGLFGTVTVVGIVTVLVDGVTTYVWYPGFFTFAVPLATRHYSAFGTLELQPIHAAYWIGAILAIVLTRAQGVSAVHCRLLILAGAGSFAAFLLQRKGWRYHILPAKSFFVLAMATAVLTWGQSVAAHLTSRRALALRRLAPVACAVCIMIAASAWTFAEVHGYNQSRQARVIRSLVSYLEGATAGQSQPVVVALSLTLPPSFPVVEMVRSEWGSRFSCLWILPGIIEEEATPNDRRGADRFGRQYLERAVSDDFERWRPDIVLVDHSRQPLPLPELLKGERFRTIWTNYHLVGQVEYFEVFRREPTRARAHDDR